jgi:hypothetical protein
VLGDRAGIIGGNKGMTGGVALRGSEGAPLGGRRADRAGDACEASQPRVGRGKHKMPGRRPQTRTMRKAPDICHNARTPLGRQTTVRRARSGLGVQAAGDRSSEGNFA